MPLRDALGDPADEGIFHQLIQYGVGIAYISEDGCNTLHFMLGVDDVADGVVQAVLDSGYTYVSK